MNVLSLFDGISCGQVALNRAGINYNNYFASEICSHSIEITQKNFPNTIQVGNVSLLKKDNFNSIDLIIGGSPCQAFSSAGKRSGMTTEKNAEILSLPQYLKLKNNNYTFKGQSYLFWEFIRLLKEINPKYFLLENVKMSKKWKAIISNTLGCEPILINSKLLSAQSRERLYWTNIPGITQPNDKKIYLESILQNEIIHTFLPKTRQDYDNYDKNKVDKSIHKITATHIGASRTFTNHIRNDGKSFTLRRVNPNGIIDENYNIRYFTPIEAERLQTLPDNYTYIDNITNAKRYEVLGNGWTVDIISHLFQGLKTNFPTLDLIANSL
jgi:DNA (cytosine-5)-methyltransferase 3A